MMCKIVENQMEGGGGVVKILGRGYMLLGFYYIIIILPFWFLTKLLIVLKHMILVGLPGLARVCLPALL
jgi:hypothetical protein